MKKTLLAVSIATLFAAGSASAVEVYSQDGMKVDMTGEFEVFVKSDVAGDVEKNGVATGDTRHSNYMELGDANLGFTMSYDIGNDFSVIGSVAFSGNDNVKLDHGWAGFKHATAGTLTFGRQTTIMDSAGVGYDKKFGFVNFVDKADFKSDQVVKYEFNNDGMFYASAAVMLHGNKDAVKNNNVIDNDSKGVDGKVGLRFLENNALDFTLFGGAYQQRDMVKKGKPIDCDRTMAELKVKWAINDSFEVQAFSGVTIKTDNSVKTGDNTMESGAYGVAGKYTLNQWAFGAGVGQAYVAEDYDNKVKAKNGDLDHKNAYLNASYDFTAHVSTYAEVGYADYADENKSGKDAGFGYAAGLKINF